MHKYSSKEEEGARQRKEGMNEAHKHARRFFLSCCPSLWFLLFLFCCYSFCKMDSRQSAIISGLFTQIEHISHNFLLPKLELLAVPRTLMHINLNTHTHRDTHRDTLVYTFICAQCFSCGKILWKCFANWMKTYWLCAGNGNGDVDDDGEMARWRCQRWQRKTTSLTLVVVGPLGWGVEGGHSHGSFAFRQQNVWC